ncbi:MAG: hypothetical protein QG600_428 [Patescibacteria group bacterium]|jgi:2-polyprenyl-3-methyl-5-hydroxy-6-metoxy-1,4-benzoquinol methylase|nr:hypothetical protein [Patescibacteria group bacterium]
MKKKRDLYSEFHHNTKSQKRTIDLDNFTYKLILNNLEKYIKDNQKILDIGSGAGTLALYCGLKRNKVTGIDVSTQAVKSANESAVQIGLNNVSFKVMKFPEEYPNEKFDLIICTEVIEHLEDDLKALKVIYKLLKPNGIAIISTPSLNAPLYKLGLATDFDKRVGHLRRYSMESLRKLSKQAGFKIVASNKQEGVIRNSLFIIPHLGELIRFIKFGLVDVVTFIDNISVKLFGESQLFIILKK